MNVVRLRYAGVWHALATPDRTVCGLPVFPYGVVDDRDPTCLNCSRRPKNAAKPYDSFMAPIRESWGTHGQAVARAAQEHMESGAEGKIEPS